MLGSYSAQCEHIGIPVNNQQHFWRLHINGCRTGGGQTESMQPLWGPTSLLESQLRNWYCRNLHYGTLLQKWANQQHMVYWCGLMSPLRMIQILLSLSPFHSSYYLYFFFISHGHCGMFFFFFFTLNVQIHEARPCCLKINTVRNKHVLKYYGMVEMVSS